MSQVLEFSSQYQKNSIEGLKPGCTVRVHQKITEGEKTRIQIFEGLVVKVNSGSHADATFTVRKVVDGVGVEKIFLLHSPNIAKIEIRKVAKVRRSKLYYMRDRSGKSASLREQQVDIVSTPMDMSPQEAPVADEAEQTDGEAPAPVETTDAPKEEAPAKEEAAPAPAADAPQEEAPAKEEAASEKEEPSSEPEAPVKEEETPPAA